MKKLALLLISFVIVQQTNAQIFTKSINFHTKYIKGNGHKITKNRTISNYNEITVTGAFKVILFKSHHHQLNITTDENVMEYIVTKVEGRHLKINVKKGYSLKNTTVKMEIPFSVLEEINLTGSGKIHSSSPITNNEIKMKVTGSGTINLDINTQETECRVSGSGDILLKGITDELDIKVTGSGDCNTYKLTAQKVKAKLTGSGDIKTSVKKEIHANCTGSGDIYYKGNPTIIKTKTLGSGNITKL